MGPFSFGQLVRAFLAVSEFVIFFPVFFHVSELVNFFPVIPEKRGQLVTAFFRGNLVRSYQKSENGEHFSRDWSVFLACPKKVQKLQRFFA